MLRSRYKKAQRAAQEILCVGIGFSHGCFPEGYARTDGLGCTYAMVLGSEKMIKNSPAFFHANTGEILPHKDGLMKPCSDMFRPNASSVFCEMGKPLPAGCCVSNREKRKCPSSNTLP